MSFDPITLALAENYTDEKAGGSSGGAVLELSEYVIPNTDGTINDYLINMVFAGGGVYVAATSGLERFWADVAAKGVWLSVRFLRPRILYRVGMR